MLATGSSGPRSHSPSQKIATVVLAQGVVDAQTGLTWCSGLARSGEFTSFVRDYHPEEVAAFGPGFAKALMAGKADASDRDDFLVFLLKVVDPIAAS